VALEPADEDRAALVAWRDLAVAGRQELRPSAAESLHLTLVFLGYRREKEIPRIWTAVSEAVQNLNAAVLHPTGVVPLPRRSPRLFALEFEDEDGRASAVQSAASERLAGERLYTPERRAWWPHLTLARVKRGARAAPLEPEERPPEPIRAPLVTLYRSLLRPQGALYVPLERLELG
jgi:RNA 2',3'-cyclic 3'-phosphodiesterase